MSLWFYLRLKLLGKSTHYIELEVENHFVKPEYLTDSPKKSKVNKNLSNYYLTNVFSYCDICNLECDSVELFKEHRIKKHQNGKYICCMYCDYKDTRWVALKCHIGKSNF